MLFLFIYILDEKNVALASDGIRVLSMESGKEVLKCADNVVCYLIS